MMYLDHSAIVAVLQKRAGWQDVARRIEDHQGKLIISPMSVCAAVSAIAGTSPTPYTIGEATEIVTEFLKEASAQQITLSTAQTRAALEVGLELTGRDDRQRIETGLALAHHNQSRRHKRR